MPSALPPVMPFELASEDLDAIAQAAREAGEIALAFFREGSQTRAAIHLKSDRSPVTDADIAVDRFLRERLGKLDPGAGWLSEESVDDLARLSRPLTWIVDPIDGTRAFAQGVRDWAISIALVRNGQPLAGVLWAPALGQLYSAAAGKGARRNNETIAVSRQNVLAGARVAGPHPMLEALSRQGLAITPMPREPSLALRIARVADGTFDAGLASVNAHDWDIAAADIILREAGGMLAGEGAAQPRYNTHDPVHGRLVSAPPALGPVLLAALGMSADAGAPASEGH